ncbi:MAG: ferrous iron transport protein B [Planctomycetota bacterium]|jgi:ferrous iron transport protein B
MDSPDLKAPNAPILVALAGQPNCGKSTIFNMLSGIHQEIANFPGVTVEQKTGSCKLDGTAVELVDLPGTYSLTSYSQEERVTRDFLLLNAPDVVIAVVDASNLARHLYFVFQLLEMNLPLILCLNMADVAERRGMTIDTEKLSALLEVPVVTTVGAKKIGKAPLQEVLLKVSQEGRKGTSSFRLDYGEDTEVLLTELESALEAKPHLMEDFAARWLAVKLLENDREAWRITQRHTHDGKGAEFTAELREKRESFVESSKRSPEKTIATVRYRRADAIEAECVTKPEVKESTLTDRIDAVLCSRALGLIAVAVCVYLTFTLTFQMADGWEWVPWLSAGEWTTTTPVGIFSWFFEEFLPTLTVGMQEGALKSLIEEAVIAGVGGVMGFVPIIFFMFVFLAMLEDSGYIARVAFVLDRALRAFGLQGQSVLPMIVSGGIAGGCAVPGVMATRTMREHKDRILTMLVAPFMSCGAKIPVYALLVAAFFSEQKGLMMWVLALIAWGLALIAAKILNKTILKGEHAPFVMELPPYHPPRIRTVLRSAGQRSWMYMKKAGTIILAINIILWALMYFPRQDTAPFEAKRKALTAQQAQSPEAHKAAMEKVNREESAAQLSQSVAGRLGQALTPASTLAGFDWRDNIALIGGFAAKEVVVSTLSTAYSMGEADPGEVEEQGDAHPLARRLRADKTWTPLRAFALMIFVMIYAPCFVTIAVIWRESGSWRWAAFSTAYTTALGFLLAVLIFQIGTAMGWGG